MLVLSHVKRFACKERKLTLNHKGPILGMPHNIFHLPFPVAAQHSKQKNRKNVNAEVASQEVSNSLGKLCGVSVE
jgi:hypothetical protein